MTIHWKAVEQYFAVVCMGFVYSLTPRVKPQLIQRFLTFDSMARTLKCDHSFNFRKSINFVLGTISSEGVEVNIY